MSKTISLYVNNKPLILLPKQKLLFNATEKEVLFSGGFGSAKTLALAVTALKHATIPNNQILIAKKTLISLKGTTLHTLLSILPPNSYKYYPVRTGELKNLKSWLKWAKKNNPSKQKFIIVNDFKRRMNNKQNREYWKMRYKIKAEDKYSIWTNY